MRPTEDAGRRRPSDPTPTAADQCAKENLPLLNAGTLTIGTDSPAFPPWFVDDDPTNGKGYESAVAYAVAEELGFTADEVTWVTVPFNNSYKPGDEGLRLRHQPDLDHPGAGRGRRLLRRLLRRGPGRGRAEGHRRRRRDQPRRPARAATRRADRHHVADRDPRRDPARHDDPLVFENTNAAKQALQNDQVDAILADLPTAFYISAVEIPNSVLVGQFQPDTGEQEEFGMLFEKGSELVPCVNEALATLREDGTLDQIEQQWLSDVVDVPELQ